MNNLGKNFRKNRVLTLAWTLWGLFYCGGAHAQVLDLVAQIGHADTCTVVALSPDNQLVATGGVDGKVTLWQAETGVQLKTFPPHPDAPIGHVRNLCFTPDGKYILVSQHSNRAVDVATGESIVLGNSGALGTATAVSRDGFWIATANQREVKVFEAKSGLERGRVLAAGDIARLDFSADGKRLIMAEDGSRVTVASVPRFETLWTYQSKANGRAAMFSPDGRALAIGGADQAVHLIDSATFQPLRSLPLQGKTVHNLAFSPDNKILAVMYEGDSLRYWDLDTGVLLPTTVSGHHWEGVFSQDNQTFYSRSGWTAWKRDITKVNGLVEYQKQTEEIHEVRFTRDEKTVFLRGTRNLWLWDLSRGRLHARFDERGTSLALAPMGDMVAVLTRNEIQLQTVSGQKKHKLKLPGGVIRSPLAESACFSPDGQTLYAVPQAAPVSWNVASGEQKLVFSAASAAPGAVTLSSDGKLLAGKLPQDKVAVWNVADGTLLREITCSGRNGDTLNFLPGQELLAVGNSLWDARTGESVGYYRSPGGVWGASFSPDGTQLLLGGWMRNPVLLNVQNGRNLRSIPVDCRVRATQFSPTGRFAVICGEDTQVRFFDTQTWTQKAAFVHFLNGDWATADAEGRFDASNPSHVAGMRWVLRLEPISLDQFKDGFYEPGLIAKQLGYSAEPLRSVPSIKNIRLFPRVKMSAPAEGEEAVVELEDQGGGIGPVTVWLNGKEWFTQDRPSAVNGRATFKLRMVGPLLSPGKPNHLKVVAYNEAGTLPSRPVEVNWQAPGLAPPREPRLFAIVCGISNYADARKIKPLRFAAKDARDMATALTLGSVKLFGVAQTEIQLFTGESGDVSGPQRALPATKINLEQAFARVAKNALPQDVVIVYLAGHGSTMGQGSSVYCYLTQEADSNEVAGVGMRNKIVTSEELADWTKQIPARKQVLILDTCAAGAAGAKLTEKRSVPGDQVRAIEKLKDRVGYHVLMGCAADSVSYEASRFNQGLLTYALLEGMRGPALTQGLVEVRDWFEYARQRVPILAGEVGGIQEPLVARPTESGKAQDFPIARLGREDTSSVPLRPAGLLVVRPRMVDMDGGDELGLEQLVAQSLIKASMGTLEVLERKVSGLSYVDAPEAPEGWMVAATYSQAKDEVTIKIKLQKPDGKFLTQTQTGAATNASLLADKIVAWVRNAAYGLHLGP